MIAMVFLMGMLFQYQLTMLTEWTWFNFLYRMTSSWITLYASLSLVLVYGIIAWKTVAVKKDNDNERT